MLEVLILRIGRTPLARIVRSGHIRAHRFDRPGSNRKGRFQSIDARTPDLPRPPVTHEYGTLRGASTGAKKAMPMRRPVEPSKPKDHSFSDGASPPLRARPHRA